MTEPLYDRVVAALGDQYELESEIGRGGMSVVYRARDLRLNRPVAVKVLPPELAFDPAIRARFTREAQTSAHLSHAHIVPIYDVGERDGIAYFVMTIVTGGNLALLLERQPRQPVEEVRRFLCEIADALAYAHLRGVIHRDVKPDNILIDADSGRMLVTDFGIARAVEAGTRLTVTGMAIGTPAYMSPEQALGEREVDGRSDIYSLGVLGYQMLTGRVPFSAGNSMALLLKHVSEPPQPIVDLRPDAPPGLREVIERAMMKSPEDRWPTAAALRDALTTERQAASWRAEPREQVRYTSPRPASVRSAPPPRDPGRGAPRPASPRGGMPAAIDRSGSPQVIETPNGPIVLEPAHLAVLTPEQRADIRLWHGRIGLYDRIKGMRGYAVQTVLAAGLAIGGVVLAVDEGVVPLIFAPAVPIFMAYKLWRRGQSLRASGLRLRRVMLMPRARWVLPKPVPVKLSPEQLLEKLAPREVLDSPLGTPIRRAVADRASIMEIAASLPKADRSLLTDLEPTVKALLERVASVAQTIYRLDQSFDPRGIAEMDARIAEVGRDADSAEGARRLTLLRRQRATLDELLQRRVALMRQLDSAGLALGNLRLDLVKLRSSGAQSALADVSTATQEAQALSREIGILLESATEAGKL
jgi:serine/threonine protein kinase